LAYRQALEQLSSILGKHFDVLYIVGGGCMNSLLCQSTANATRTLVQAGPGEATVAGNILTQAVGRGYLTSPGEIREVIRRSTAMVEYEPKDAGIWEDRYAKYLQIIEDSRH
jgi:rhamnulokinase/L-fuculokinase